MLRHAGSGADAAASLHHALAADSQRQAAWIRSALVSGHSFSFTTIGVATSLTLPSETATEQTLGSVTFMHLLFGPFSLVRHLTATHRVAPGSNRHKIGTRFGRPPEMFYSVSCWLGVGTLASTPQLRGPTRYRPDTPRSVATSSLPAAISTRSTFRGLQASAPAPRQQSNPSGGPCSLGPRLPE